MLKKLYPGCVFRNSNGHLSMVYRETSDRYHIINYNGSDYAISKNIPPSYRISALSLSLFLKHFPSEIITDEVFLSKFHEICANEKYLTSASNLYKEMFEKETLSKNFKEELERKQFMTPDETFKKNSTSNLFNLLLLI